ncbi:MAG: FAD-dependent oxidoreductase [Solirubrobacterales bacterium]|nr:FAD-dependent oxidoreductase [Solirubrobacterales bacterium]
MAGLSAAWALSGEHERGELDVCVYEAAPHPGGKGASTRGVHGRIEEHGLHVWLGYYDNAFRLMRDVYEELDRAATDPGCPIQGWRDAFAPADLVGVEDRRDGTWSHWVAAFARNDGEPGLPGGRPLTVAGFVRRGLGLLVDFSASIGAAAPPRVVLSGAAEPPPRGGGPAAFVELLRRAEIAALVGAVESLRVLRAGVPRGGSLATLVTGYLDGLRADLVARAARDDAGRRSAELADLVATTMLGTIRDGLLSDPAGFTAIDHLDFRAWLAGHGARPETLDCALVRGMYDLAFAFEDGDRERPRFPAGLGLFLAGKLFFEYRGSIMWRLQAGMGDVVFAPLLQALRGRGVTFRPGHRAQRLRLSPGRGAVAAIDLRVRARDPDPLVRVHGLPCFPTPAGGPVGERDAVLRAGADFDDVVLATSLGPVASLCEELLEDSPRWRAMVQGVATVPTQALQLWLRADERRLGWPYPGATVSGYVSPFDTYASMSHLVEREDWPAGDRPGAIGYFCSVLPARDAADGERVVRANARRFLERDVAHLWPGFRAELVRARYTRANVAPADRYVQALPGTGRLRLRADASGYGNLFLAGDWIDCGLNAGCIEAAVLAGVQAANAVRGHPPAHGVAGSWIGLGAA